MKSVETLLKETANPLAILKPPKKGIWIGINALDERKVILYDDDRKVHQHIIGLSGTGK